MKSLLYLGLMTFLIFGLTSCKKDTTPPELRLLGAQKMSLPYGTAYIEPGFEALDNENGDLKSQVNVSGNVNSDSIGVYHINYRVEDAQGNSSGSRRTICVYAQSTHLVGSWYGIDTCSSAVLGYPIDILAIDSTNFEIKNLSAFSPDFRVRVSLQGELGDEIHLDDWSGGLHFVGSGILVHIDTLKLNYSVTDSAGSSQTCRARFARN